MTLTESRLPRQRPCVGSALVHRIIASMHEMMPRLYKEAPSPMMLSHQEWGPSGRGSARYASCNFGRLFTLSRLSRPGKIRYSLRTVVRGMDSVPNPSFVASLLRTIRSP